jgi:predicted extracellular nuclease
MNARRADGLLFCASNGSKINMSLRLATFNVENLMNRFDFSGFRNQLYQDRVLSLFEIKDEAEYRHLERARAIAHTDDTRQLTALAIADTRADIICLQEVDNMEALRAFEYGYLFKMVGAGYREKYTTPGNDGRGIDVAVMVREQTLHGQRIEFVRMQSHAHVTYDEMGLFNEDLASVGEKSHERIFRRDCLELDLKVDGKPLTIYSVHFKSMGGGPRNGKDGREATMPVRNAEAMAVRKIIEERFGADRAGDMRWAICGDFNDYRERVLISGDLRDGFVFQPVQEEISCLNVLTGDGFSVNVVERRPEIDRWTLYHTRGPAERHLCQLDYILSPSLARHNGNAIPEILRAGQPFRTPFPPGQEVERYPRVGWDRPKASDHCPVVVQLDII